MSAADLHPAVESAFNAGDLRALVALYETDARIVSPDGVVAKGPEGIAEAWSTLLSMQGRIRMTTHSCVEYGDVALLSNDWTFTTPDFELSGSTAEVARRQPDGTWLYAIDNPVGGSPDAPRILPDGTEV